MVTIEEIQAAYYMVAATGVLVAAGYYVMNMRQTIENRKAQLFTQLTSMFLQKEFLSDSTELLSLQWTDFDDFARKYDSGVNPSNYVKRMQVCNFLEQLGFYLRKKQIDVEQLSTVNGGNFWVVWLWEKYGPIWKRYREIMNLPDLYVNFEYLAGEIVKYQSSRGHEVISSPTGGAYFPDAK
jgi:hypothetical protein